MEEPHYVTMSITGWVLDEALADTRRRHFFIWSLKERPPTNGRSRPITTVLPSSGRL